MADGLAAPDDWKEPDASVLDLLTRHGKRSADPEVIGFQGTASQQTRVAVRAALRMLLANGLISVVPQADWPRYVALDPPAGQ